LARVFSLRLYHYYAGLGWLAALAALDADRFLRLTTPVRQNITTVTKDDSRTTLEIVNLKTGSDTLAGRERIRGRRSARAGS
jgi:hypothetical protein